MPAAARTLEIVWQQDPTAYVFARAGDGTLSAEGLHAGTPAAADLSVARRVDARRVGVRELVSLAAAPPTGLEPGGSARAVFAIVELAHRSVSEGLVHPYLDHGDGGWHAFWGATLDATVQATLAEIAAALPAVAADAFAGDREATVQDLYPVVVDQIARDRLRAGRVSFVGRLPVRPSALDLYLEGLVAAESLLPPHSGYAALRRQLARWVYDGLGVLARGSEARWKLSLHLDERTEGGETELVLELWLQAEDDPLLSLPAALVWEGGADIFSFLRASDPRDDLTRQLAELEPLFSAHGIRFDGAESTEAKLDVDAAGVFLRESMPQLEESGVPVLLPSAWVRAPSRLRVNLKATSRRDPTVRSSGLLSTASLMSFDWRLAVGDASFSEEELVELAKAKDPFVRAGGRWHALRQSEVERALRFLERRRTGSGIVDLVRAVSGLDTDEAGLELGEVSLDESLAELLGDDDRRFRSLPTPASMAFALFPFQERGHGWLRMLGDLGVGAILADDMGLGKTVQAIAMLASEREETQGLGPTLVVCPMSVVKQWAAEIERFAPGLRVLSHHGVARLKGDGLVEGALACDVVVTSYDIATRDIETLALVDWDRLLLDEAQDIKNPATKRARALRRVRARRRVAMTGTPIENRLGELWAIMDIVNPGLLGPRDWFDRTFARPIEESRDEQALERLRAIVQPFVLRRAKDAPEVELELPPITIEKDYCRLTVEQAALYQATVDRWLPRIEEQRDTFGQRGSVLAMLSQLKRVCNHPELLLPTGEALEGRSGKLDRLVELLQQVPAGDKALVFTQYPGFDRLVPHLAEHVAKRVGFFHGRLTARQRDDVLRAFETEDGPSVLVISIKAGGRGLNLPAANHVIHFDRWWNPAVEQQATDRVHRVGQRKPVFVHSLICLGTLEERIDQLLESKRELAAKVIHGGSEDWLGQLDIGAIRAAVALSPDWMEAAA
jgi:SNF2-related domain/SNF2 Helicase protein/Helicase conserved C-terminal domain